MRGDEQWDKVPILLVCYIENTLAISAASMAALKPLLVKLGYIGDSPVNSRYSYPSYGGRLSGYMGQQESGQGNNTSDKGKAPTASTGENWNIYVGPKSRGAYACSAIGGTNGGVADMRCDNHATWGHGRPAGIELGKLDESINDETCGQGLAVPNPRKIRKPIHAFGILRTCTIETRRERIDEQVHSASTVNLAGTEMPTGSHPYHETGHGHEVNAPTTGAGSSDSIPSSLNTKPQFTLRTY